MRLPQPQLQRLCFVFNRVEDFLAAMGNACSRQEAEEIRRLTELSLPPVTSQDGLATLFGYNPGFIWSLVARTERHYRRFPIPKGRGHREIEAPKVGLKAIQKWLSVHFQTVWQPDDWVFGFVPGRSHILAAERHLNAEWVWSVDIKNFFPSVSIGRVQQALEALGYRTASSLNVLSSICCLNGRLVQGAPTSPVLSNIVLQTLDQQIAEIAGEAGARFTRYADDVVISGNGEPPIAALEEIKAAIRNDGWVLSARKERLNKLPGRLKVHGILVHGERLRLTKGYRNRLRAFRHLLDNEKVNPEDIASMKGHLNYSAQIEKK